MDQLEPPLTALDEEHGSPFISLDGERGPRIISLGDIAVPLTNELLLEWISLGILGAITAFCLLQTLISPRTTFCSTENTDDHKNE